MNKIKKYILNMLLFVFLIWLTFKILFANQDMDELLMIFHSTNKMFLVCCCLSMLIYCMLEALNLMRTLK